MPRKSLNRMQQKSALRRAASAVKRLFARGQEEKVEWTLEAAPQTRPTAQRPVQRKTDIPLDVLDRAYIPPVTSSKASFRSDGGDHQRDQDLELGLTGERWNDEDRYTNKSGDPRIGTHGRTNEPAETYPAKRD